MSCFFFLLGTAKGHFPSLVLSLESQRGFPQSLSYRRYAAPQLWRNSLRLSEEKTDPPVMSIYFPFSLVFLCHSLVEKISRREPPRWFWLSQLGHGAGHREDHSQHQMGNGKQSSCAEVVQWGGSMRTLHVSRKNTYCCFFWSFWGVFSVIHCSYQKLQNKSEWCDAMHHKTTM